MTTSTATLSSWLLDQIAADETVARTAVLAWDAATDEAVPWNSGGGPFKGDVFSASGERVAETRGYIYAAHIARHDPARVLATCAAHRSIVEMHTATAGVNCYWCSECGVADRGQRVWPCPTLRALAAIYADREGFDPRWSE